MAIRIMLSRRLGELRWTQADLIRATGIRRSTINEYYHELVDRINLEHLDLICEALQCDVTDLLFYVPNKEGRVKCRGGFPKPSQTLEQQAGQEALTALRRLVVGIELGAVIPPPLVSLTKPQPEEKAG